MKRFARGQRVKVLRDENAQKVEAVGVVRRVNMNDERGWIELDTRHKNQAVHPFPEHDSRGRWLCAWPDDCEMVQ